MDIDLKVFHAWIAAEAMRGLPVAQSMQRLLDECANFSPHPDWERFRSLPYGDLAPAIDWLTRVFENEPAPQPLQGLWFGLFNPYGADGKPVAELYVCGSDRFDPDPEDSEWACDPEWWPQGRYARSAILAEIYRNAYRPGGLENNAEYPLCLGYATFAVHHALSVLPPSLLLGNSRSLGVAVGFDSGDFILLGKLGPAGLEGL